jgi:parallel beta-helix repeat protein
MLDCTFKTNEQGILISNFSNNNLISTNILAGHTLSGITVDSSENSTVTDTLFSNNSYGIKLQKEAGANEFQYNEIVHNDHGIVIDDCSLHNKVYFNRFNNTINAVDEGNTTCFDNGYPFGGNWWSDYIGDDRYRGENQSIPGPDGIGDTPYNITGGVSKDNYPLMHPYDALYPVLNIDTGCRFSTIQEAINDASGGHTLFARATTYNEHIEIDKPLTLFGQDKRYTTISSTSFQPIVSITATNVHLSGFSLKGGGSIEGRTALEINANKATICDLAIHQCDYGLRIVGEELSFWNSHTIDGIIVNNKPLYYYKNEQSSLVPSDAGQIILTNCSNFKIHHCSMSDLSSAIQLAFCSNISLSNNTNTSVFLWKSNNTTLKNNTISNTCDHGLTLYHSFNTIITKNIFLDNEVSINLYFSDKNVVDHNMIRSTYIGIRLGWSNNNTISNNSLTSASEISTGNGLYISDSNENVVGYNIIENCDRGILVSAMCPFFGTNNDFHSNIIFNNHKGVQISGWAYGNIIKQNIISNNTKGIILGGTGENIIVLNTITNSSHTGILNKKHLNVPCSSNNCIYHNHFINNHKHAHDECTNFWNTSYPSGGNFWDDYEGCDNFSGPLQNINGSDGIGDSPYTIQGGGHHFEKHPILMDDPHPIKNMHSDDGKRVVNKDYYPLMEPLLKS